MSDLELIVDGEVLTATLLPEKAPESVAAVREFLPLHSELMHVRWSGHATWTNIDEIDLPEVPRENHTVYPSYGDLLLYPGYRNEQEILVPCGPTCFKSPVGELAGNHFATLDTDRERLAELEERTLRDGALDITVRIVDRTLVANNTVFSGYRPVSDAAGRSPPHRSPTRRSGRHCRPTWRARS